LCHVQLCKTVLASISLGMTNYPPQMFLAESRDPFVNFGGPVISLEYPRQDLKISTQEGHHKISLGMTKYLKVSMVSIMWPIFKFWCPIISLEQVHKLVHMTSTNIGMINCLQIGWFEKKLSRYGYDAICLQYYDIRYDTMYRAITNISEMVQDRDVLSYNGRLIGNHMWPIKWHHYQWHWVCVDRS